VIYKYLISGNPVPLARCRVNFAQRKVWDSQRKYKVITGIEISRQHGNLPFFEGPLRVDVLFFMKRPQSLQARKATKKYHCYTPDCDNLLKQVLDILTGVIFKDDCIVSFITAQKRYDSDPRTEIVVKELNNESE